MINNVILTTNAEIAGHKILKHYGLISSTVVIGVDFVKEFIASFTDVFGGYSDTFRDEIESAKNKAYRDIKRKAMENNLNAIVKASVHVEPITGKDLMMFMVTVTGTGVLIDNYEIYNKNNTDYENECDKVRQILKTLDVEKNEVGKEKLLSKMTADELEDFILNMENNQIVEVINAILDELKSANSKIIPSNTMSKIKIIKSYINKFEANIYNDLLFKNLNYSKVQLVSVLKIMSYKSIFEELTKNNTSEYFFEVISMLSITPEFIEKEDYKYIKDILNIINERYSDKVEIKKANRFSKQEVWICKKCKHTVDLTSEVCSMCNYNKYGILTLKQEGSFNRRINLNKTIKMLTKIYNQLKEIYM